LGSSIPTSGHGLTLTSTEQVWLTVPMSLPARSLPLFCGIQLAFIALAIGAGCGGSVVCERGACSGESTTASTTDGGSSTPAGGGGSGGSFIGTTGDAGAAGSSGGGGNSITGPALVYPYSFGEDLEVVRISTEILNCSKLNWSISNDNCDWWELEIGIPVDAFAPGSFPIDFGTFVTFEAAAAHPDCIVMTGGGLFHSQDAVLTILEVTDSSVSIGLTGVSPEDMNGHEVNGEYTALRCSVP